MHNKSKVDFIPIYPGTKIFVYAPAAFASGGPELLHQLAYKLRTILGFDAYMYYFPENIANPVPEPYQNYANPYCVLPEDRAENVLVLPETADIHKIVKKFPKSRKVFWWLSVDNHYVTLPKLMGRINSLIFSRTNYRGLYLSSAIIRRPEILHLAQSMYAMEHLRKQGISSLYISDFLNRDFLGSVHESARKENVVAYNPAKGRKFTSKLISQSSDIKFVPILNMTRAQVVELLSKAKVYIDFGHHPGKDRIPREAAILGCCVITGLRGAAKYRDVGIPQEYKFEDKNSSIPAIREKIKKCFLNYSENLKNFEEYREIISLEERRFDSDLKKIFVPVA